MIQNEALTLALGTDREAMIERMRRNAANARGRARSGPMTDDSVNPDEENSDAAQWDRIADYLTFGKFVTLISDAEYSACMDLRKILTGRNDWPFKIYAPPNAP